jgi:hypothetical protein
MSHFAKIENGIVTEVLVVEQDFINTGALGDPSLWVQTSYNTRGNVHVDPVTKQPDGGVALRGNYAVIGGTYDAVNDVFYEAQPYPSWTLDTSTWLWEPPIPRIEGDLVNTIWNEDTQSWGPLPVVTTPYPEDGGIYIWDIAKQEWVTE